MIKLWLKHKLAELTLNNAFSSLIQNFTPTPQLYNVGDKFTLLQISSCRPSKEIRHSALRDATILANNHGILHIAFKSVLYDYYVDRNGIIHEYTIPQD
jgi:hypothetical protein